MAKQEPSVDQWLVEAKASEAAAQCGMFLTHNGVVRITPKAQVRQGEEGLPEVVAVDFSYDAEGLAAAEKEALTWPGVYYVRTWRLADVCADWRRHSSALHRCTAKACGSHQK